jgi:hypothetical protein
MGKAVAPKVGCKKRLEVGLWTSWVWEDYGIPQCRGCVGAVFRAERLRGRSVLEREWMGVWLIVGVWRNKIRGDPQWERRWKVGPWEIPVLWGAGGEARPAKQTRGTTRGIGEATVVHLEATWNHLRRVARSCVQVLMSPVRTDGCLGPSYLGHLWLWWGQLRFF